VVAVTFVVIGLNVVHMVDEKPKTTPHLQRLRNVEATPTASLLVDHYDEEWTSLWWVRVDGEVTVEKDTRNWWEAHTRLKGKYRQYRNHPPNGPAIFLSIDHVSYWQWS
jgi:PPOX class probable F420-dependent enzyme